MNKFNFLKNFYGKNNLKIFPIYKDTKMPMIDEWQKDCSSDMKQIMYWLEKGNNCNFGLPANPNNLFIIDLDVHEEDKNGVKNFKKLCDDLGIDEPKTLKQSTPSGGKHFIFKSDEDLSDVRNSANTYGELGYAGIDVRTKGYIVVEPSVTEKGAYKLDTTYEISEMPKELKDFIINNENKRKNNKKVVGYEKPLVVEKGGRDNALFDYIINLYHNTRLNNNEIKLLAHYFNNSVCKPPLSDKDVEYKVDRIFNQERSEYLLVRIGVKKEE